MEKHTVKSYDDELKHLKSLINNMGEATLRQLSQAFEALVARNIELAMKVIESGDDVDRMQAAVDELTVRMLGKRQPMGIDLRVIFSGQKIAANLERIGDYAENIARHTEALNLHSPNLQLASVEKMGEIAVHMLSSVMSSHNAEDTDLAVKVWHQDDEMDAAYTRLLDELRHAMMENPGNIQAGTNVLLIGRCAERIGDLVTNIAESVYYIAHGKTYSGQS
ncbi:phosphate signaling complex protein PhoU [Desulfococcus sp.]|uniref:phosphate signaling complex protein PhoU n=1 Tax=Desulfococcus sp. TaxID=2025834 RepID=UPI003593D844